MDEWVNKLLRVKNTLPVTQAQNCGKDSEMLPFPPRSSVMVSANEVSPTSASCSFHFPCYVLDQAFLNARQVVAVSSFWSRYLLAPPPPSCSLAHCHFISFPRTPKGKTYSSHVSPLLTHHHHSHSTDTRCVVLSHTRQFSLTLARCPIICFNSSMIYLEIVSGSMEFRAQSHKTAPLQTSYAIRKSQAVTCNF